MKLYIMLDKDNSWRVGIDVPKWRNNRYGFELTFNSTGICWSAASKMLDDLGHNADKFKAGEYLECDVS